MRTRKLIYALVAPVALLSALLVAAPTVQAAPATVVEFSDSFEGNPWNRWEGFAGGDGVAGADYGQGLARTGANNGWLYAGRGWASERIAVPIGSWQDRSNCTASIYANPVRADAQVGLEIWDPNGWRKVSATASWLVRGSYQKITTPPVNLNGVSTVFVQAVYGSSSGAVQHVRIDDVALRCVS